MIPNDPLDNAMKAAAPQVGAAIDQIASNADAQKAKLESKLPRTKDPELLKKEKEAEVQEKFANKKQELLQKKSKALELIKNLAIGVGLSLLGGLGGKIGAAIGIGNQILGIFRRKKSASKRTKDMVKFDKKTKETEKERVKTSQQNHKKNVTAFTYPLVPTDTQNKPITSPPAPSTLPITSSPPAPTPVPTPTPTPAPKGDFYILGSIDFGTYTGWTAYYKDTPLVSSNLYKDTEPSAQKIIEVEKNLSYDVCVKASGLLSSGATNDWVKDSRITNGCPNTLDGSPGGFSIGVSNVIVNGQ